MQTIQNQMLKFNSLKNLNSFVNMTVTDQANFYALTLKDDIKILGKMQEIYFYDEITKLWKVESPEVYASYFMNFFNNTAKQMKKDFRLYTIEMDEDDSLYKNMQTSMLKLIKLFDNKNYITDIIDRSIGKLQDNGFVLKLNNSPDIFPIKNGLKIDLKTLQISERTKEDYFTFESPVDFVTNTPNANKYFSQLMPDHESREYLRKCLGYCLSGDVDAQVFFVWYGSGRNGKSKLSNCLKKIMGKFYHQCASSIFIKSNSSSGASPDKIALIGSRMAVYSEGDTADAIQLNFSSIKEISGKDTINARPLYKAPLEFNAQCKLNLLTNYTPPLSGQHAIVERLRYLYFDSEFCDKPKEKHQFLKDNIFGDLIENEYLSEVFTWIVKGAKEYYIDKRINMPESFKQRTTQVINLEDSITSYINTKLLFTKASNDYIRRGALFENYKTYCDTNSQRCQPRSSLFNRLSDLRIDIAKLDGYDIYRGVKFSNDIICEELDEVENKTQINTLFDTGVDKNDQSIKQSEKLIIVKTKKVKPLKNDIEEDLVLKELLGLF
jgi:P4 family phage/plasmid primase-like protien